MAVWAEARKMEIVDEALKMAMCKEKVTMHKGGYAAVWCFEMESVRGVCTTHSR